MQNFYKPCKVKIIQIIKETPDTKTFVLGHKTAIRPGQFFMVGLFGIGEVPISISDSFDGKISVSIKNVGSTTSSLHNLKKGNPLFIRGPFGNGFDMDLLKNKEILIVAGGLGIAPLRPLINYIINNKKDFKKLFILYGARTPQDILFKNDLKRWSNKKDIQMLLTVDSPDAKWKMRRGVVTALLKEIKPDLKTTAAVVCGPPIMMRYTAANLIEMKLDPSQILLSLERHMKCGIGKCGHCYTGEKFVCSDGPVFSYSQLLKLKPQVEL